MVEVKASTLISTGLFLLAFVIYFNSINYHTPNLYHWNFLFEADSPRVISVFTHATNTTESFKHPLYALFFKPIGRRLNNLLNDPAESTLFITCLIGSLSVVLMHRLLTKSFPNGRFEALLFTALYAFSASVWLMCSVPETYSLNICMIVLSFYLYAWGCRQRGPGGGLRCFLLYVVFSSLATGITIANSVYFLLSYFSVMRKKGGKITHVTGVLLLYQASVCLVIGLLSLIQSDLYPSAHRFDSIKGYLGIFHVLPIDDLLILEGKLLFDAGRIKDLLSTFLIFSIVSPGAALSCIFDYGLYWSLISYESKLNFSHIALITAYLVFFLGAVLMLGKQKFRVPHGIRLALFCLAFSLLLSFILRVLGPPVIYSVYSVPSIILIMAYAYQRFKFTHKQGVLLIFVCIVAANNFLFINEVDELLIKAVPKDWISMGRDYKCK